MNVRLLLAVARRLMRCPAVPYDEEGVRAEAERICADFGLDCRRDGYGNLWVRVATTQTLRPLVLAAHLDHPGFKLLRKRSPTRLLAQFQGGVPDRFFKRGIPLRLMPGDHAARLGQRVGKDKRFQIQVDQSVPGWPQFAVWDLTDFSVRKGKIYGRACDDLIGVAVILTALIELKRNRARVNVVGVLTRAEEVGFHGALALASSGRLPKKSLIISLETSRAMLPVKLGKGVIIRVGDRTSVFDAAATRYLAEVAARLAGAERTFTFQRALMSGGTCEATAYQAFGYQTAAVCVALGNYHNCGPRGSIAAEFVSANDACQMVKLMVAAAREMPQYSERVSGLTKRLVRWARVARNHLPTRP